MYLSPAAMQLNLQAKENGKSQKENQVPPKITFRKEKQPYGEGYFDAEYSFEGK